MASRTKSRNLAGFRHVRKSRCPDARYPRIYSRNAICVAAPTADRQVARPTPGKPAGPSAATCRTWQLSAGWSACTGSRATAAAAAGSNPDRPRQPPGCRPPRARRPRRHSRDQPRRLAPDDPRVAKRRSAGDRMKAAAGTASFLGCGRVITITCSPGTRLFTHSRFRGPAARALRRRVHGRRWTTSPAVTTCSRGSAVHHQQEPYSSSRDAWPMISWSPGSWARTCLPSVDHDGLNPLVQRRAAGHARGGIAVGIAEAAVEHGKVRKVALQQHGPVRRPRRPPAPRTWRWARAVPPRSG